MSRTVSSRISNDLHDELREKCNRVGCSMNDYIDESIKYMLTGNSEFDFGDEEEEEDYVNLKIFNNNTDENDLPEIDVKSGKLYDEKGNLIGRVKQYKKPHVVMID